MASIYWFRRDLRISDNSALAACILASNGVIPVYIHCDESGLELPSGASDWWLHQSLSSLSRELELRGSRLIIRQGSPADVLTELCTECGASSVYSSERVEPAARVNEADVEVALAARGVTYRAILNGLLWHPSDALNNAGKAFQVFTPFWKALQRTVLPPPAPIIMPAQINPPVNVVWPVSIPLSNLNLLSNSGWDTEFYKQWQPGEAGARASLNRFLESSIDYYPEQRDFPAAKGVSRLSPHLAFGEISPAQIIRGIYQRRGGPPITTDAETAYVRQIAWREFAAHLLWHFPHTLKSPLRQEYDKFPWQPDDASLIAWQTGNTGYPMVDAGMRELWATGWMHNRVRMLVASFLVKHLLIDWKEGASWFWDTLVDADPANNTLGWQWTAGCGADAAPYFRIFNPVLQGQRFDPDGSYIRKWIPEISSLAAVYIHQPWMAPQSVLAACGIQLGATYPYPIVDHNEARQRALQSLAVITGSRSGGSNLEGTLNL